jgi:TIR domain
MSTPILVTSHDGPYAFVSYAHADRKVVQPYVAKLRAQGLPIWWDDRIAPGTEWVQAIADAIVDCSVFLLLVTRGIAESEFCFREIVFAQNERICTIVSYLDWLRLPNRLRFLLAPVHAVFDGADDCDRVAETLRHLLATAPARTRELALATPYGTEPGLPRARWEC